MAIYTFSGFIPSRTLRVQREEDEKKAERLHNDFSHHINPLQEHQDNFIFHTLVHAPRGMTKAQEVAFGTAMNHALRHFQADFEYELREQEEKLKEKSNEDQPPTKS